MTHPHERRRLDDVLRRGETTAGLVLLLRGGAAVEGIARLRAQAADMNSRFTFEGDDCYGVSVFAATEESESWVLATKMDVRRRYYRVRHADIAKLRVVPTFGSPHWTVVFGGSAGPEYQYFLDALGELRDNPYWSRQPGRRPR